ncbi:Hypothetical predicted protein [Mytilus galloprovincialis]|uniref:COR domain-containing protein n=1 Tax=Mytilus galloprovincialis TaxID=29158 RepID=A0A8B6HAC2_MYTGA|nr:Hypothetical predicted protein [Mytilus galloprovincialis]
MANYISGAEYEDYWQLGLPIEVKELDKKSAKVFASLLEEDEYQHHEARVMLAGEQGTGKTTVARYLVGKGPTKIRMSTDGIDLYNGLSFIDRETKEWLHGKQDFTLSEIAISRTLRQEEGISINLNANEQAVHPETSEIPFENISRSAHFNLHSPYMTTKQELILNDSIPVNNAVTLENFMEVQENHSGNGSYIVGADETIPDQPEKMQNKYSNYDKNVDPSFTDSSRIVKEQIQIESLPAFSEESSEENQIRENTVIAQSEVHLEPTIGRLNADAAPQGDTFVPRTEIVKCTHAGKSSEGSITTEVVNDPGIISKLKNLFGIHKHVKEIKVSMTKEQIWKKTLKVGKKKLHQKKIAPVIIWDFGGQDVFYSTHQTFLTYRAIYLIVLDGSRNLDDPCPFEQYLPGKSGQKTARDYLKFWINTIVTYCKGSRPGFPKIMIVLTHKDKVKAEEVESRRVQVFHDLEKMFSGSPLISHLVIKDRIFVNARNKDDPEMTKIKQNIIHQAMDQPTWGQRLPKCFIPLELEFDSLLDRNIPLITMEHMTTINHVHPVRSLTEEELQVFLKFQHSVGRILYFEAAHLNQHIILAPTHLIDAFKSIVTDRSFCKGDRLRQESWDLMSQKGVIKKKSIEEIWKKNKYKKFQEHKEYLLGVMTHLDILVEPKRYDKSHKRIPAEFYFIASMVRTNNTTGYLESPNFTQRNIAIAFISTSSMIPPALSFRFISYCLSLFAVKTHGQENDEMLFRMSAVFTIDPSLDMCVSCDDDIIVVRLVHSINRALIMRDLASSVKECLAAALEKISQLYVKTSSTGSPTGEALFNLSLCCSSPVDPCLLPMFKLQEQDDSWICPKHGIEHTKDVLSSWALQKEQIQCGIACPVTDNDFLNQLPTDIHLRRLSMQYSVNELKELLIYLKKDSAIWEALLHDDSQQTPDILKFETLRKYRDEFGITFNDIKQAIESGNIRNTHTLCKVVRGKPIDFDQEPELWDLIPSEQHFDKMAPLVGNNSLAFLVELGMEFATWEQIRFRQNDRDLVKLNLKIMQEWKTFCNLKTIRPSLRHIGQAFNNIGKHIKLVENALADFF